MKRMLLSSLLLTVITLAAVFVVGKNQPQTSNAPQPTHITAQKLSADEKRRVTVLIGDKPYEMTVHDYLIKVVAAEMPVSFEPEALKAQAVAARTYLQRALASPKHDNADICASSDCCQAYSTEKKLREKWGEDYERYLEKITAAVEDTDGEYLSYEGKAALAAFHSSSAGVTENSGAIWNELPYLVSVSSPETAENVPNYISKLTLKDIDFRDTILYLKPEADMTGEAASWVSDIKRNDSGRVEKAVIGGVEFTGAELRKLFSLRSTAFELSHSDGQFTFTVTGYGHGVGMSQYGANAMAKNGSDYREILSHYYPGTTLS